MVITIILPLTLGISRNLSGNESLVSTKNTLGLSETLVCFLSGWMLGVNTRCREISLSWPSSLHTGSNGYQSWLEKWNLDLNWAFGRATRGKWTRHWGFKGWGFEFAVFHDRWFMDAPNKCEGVKSPAQNFQAGSEADLQRCTGKTINGSF